MAALEAYGDFFSLNFDALVPELHAHDRVNDLHAGVQEFQVFRFVRCAQHIGVGGIRFFDGHLIVKTAGNHEFRHLMTTTQFVDEVGIQPRFVNLQLGVGQQAITIETFDIVAFIGTAVTPDIHAIFFHGGNQHGARHGAAQRSGIEIGQAASGVMKSTALNRSDTFGYQLFAAVNQSCVLCAILHGTTRDRVIIFLIWLSQVRSICIRNRSLLAHPQQCSAGIQAA